MKRVTSKNCVALSKKIKKTQTNYTQAQCWVIVFNFLLQRGMETELTSFGIENVILFLEKNLKKTVKS